MGNIIKILFVALLFSNAGQAQKPTDVVSAFSKSYVLEFEKKYASAIATLADVYQADSYMLNARLAWLSFLELHFKQSIDYYEKAIKLRPYAIEARLGIVKPLAELEEWQKVKNQYLEILKIDAQNITANYWLGVMLYNSGNYLQGIKYLEKNVNLYPFHYDSVIMLAWAKLKTGNKADANILFNQALLIKPDDVAARDGLALSK